MNSFATQNSNSIASFNKSGDRYILRDPTLAPLADAFLWNNRLLFRVTCRGFAWTTFMQPEAATYTHHPTISAKTFILPDPVLYAHHPGRFFYIRDDDSMEIFSAPYEPVRRKLDRFEFSPGLSDIQWDCMKGGISVKLQVTIPRDDLVECWKVALVNESDRTRNISLYPYFPIGFGSWMQTGGFYDVACGGVLCRSLTPYQKTEDYYKNRNLKDYTYLICDHSPQSWDACVELFEGEGGLTDPDALKVPFLDSNRSHNENTAAILQFCGKLDPGEKKEYAFLFGPARDKEEILDIRRKYFEIKTMPEILCQVADYHSSYSRCIQIETPDQELNHFVNNWLPRQLNYHGKSSRLTADPQTRNYIQDAMGMAFIDQEQCRAMYRHALSQQMENGEMPDGIRLVSDVSLSYINQVPHRDHGVWAPLSLPVYLSESGDIDFLNETVPFSDTSEVSASVYEHICRSLEWLLQDRTERGLSPFGQGDWNDPLNMAGYKGKGETAWLTEALGYALGCWLPWCEQTGDVKRIKSFSAAIESINQAINDHFWDGNWYARGSTDDGYNFGTSRDDEGKIFLNPQSWGILCGAADDDKVNLCMAAVEENLITPWGPMVLAPAFTQMREDIGRLTQKYPGITENGSIYCHAAIFYIFALFSAKKSDHAFRLLRSLLSGGDAHQIARTQQLPIYLPNCYRGGPFERIKGRSSRNPNTGTISWYYRCVIEQLFGLRGEGNGLRIDPQLPDCWDKAIATRQFRGNTFDISYLKKPEVNEIQVFVDGVKQRENWIPVNLESKEKQRVEVFLPVYQGDSRNEGD